MALPIRGVAYTLYVRLIDAANNTQVISPSLVAGDVTVSIDDGAPANLATLPTVVQNKLRVDLSAAEMDSSIATYLKFKDQDGPVFLPLDVTVPTI